MRGAIALYQTVRARGSLFGVKGASSSSLLPSCTTCCSTNAFGRPGIRSLDSAARQLSSRKPLDDDHNLVYRIPPIPKPLASYVRLWGIHEPDDYNPNSEFTVIFLGTGAGVPTTVRQPTATALMTEHSTLIFDAGEGVFTQLMRSRVSFKTIDKIFSKLLACCCVLLVLDRVNNRQDRLLPKLNSTQPNLQSIIPITTVSHMHGDHVFGLPCLILAIQALVPQKPIQIFGPVGLYNFIATCLSLSYVEIRGNARIEVYELQGGSRRWGHPAAGRVYPEFRHRGIIRKSIPRNPDGTWTLCSAIEVTGPDEVLKRHESAGVHVTAAEVEHVPKLNCFGFVVEEARTLPRKIDPARAEALGVEQGKKYQLLKYGIPVMSDDGSREVRPEEVLLEESVRPRKLVALGDCCNVPHSMAKLCHDADILIHEATLSEKDEGKKVDFGGHSSAAQAGRFGNKVSPTVLALNHISSSKNSNIREHVHEAEKEITNGKTHVLAAADLMEISVPMAGYDLPKIKVEASAGGIDDEVEAKNA